MLPFYTFIIFIGTVVCLLYYYLKKKLNYWKERDVPHVKPLLIFGNYLDYIFLRKPALEVADELCKNLPDEPYFGVYFGSDPALMVKDPELIKLILSKDFYYFNMREIADFIHNEPVTQNMFFGGGDRWRVIRQNLSPLFSSIKLKSMFYIIENCAKTMEATIREEMNESRTFEVKSLLTRYTIDCVGSCVFGVNTGTLGKNYDKNPFTLIAGQLFDVTSYGGFKLVTRAMWPSIFYGLGLKMFSDNVNNFFSNLLIGVFESRDHKESGRHDFVDLLLNWKQKDFLCGDSITNMKTGEKKTIQLNIDEGLIIGQCALLFAAGYETTATTTSLLLYELAKNKDVQARVIDEVDEYYKRHHGKIEFEAINEMPYLQACIDETLRFYPVLGLLTREAVEGYTLPTGLHLPKGTRIHIPVYHIHHNPKYFSEPERWLPERFYGEGKHFITPFTYMPFGEGPRVCLGKRFSKMPMYAGLLTIFKNYELELDPKTPSSYKFQPRTFVTQALGGIFLKFIPRK
ncbi:cytochrome P450 6B2-like [Danaus plexippus]|uniref:cytochrome P450 6B2-like n=1 Tax=Danaus plexippus TaxID=13037 RepID=UPI002AAF3BB4|nr:cytochrome P450 6B2-like [Danaus plexippus]